MAGKSDYLESAILNHVLRNTALTSPTTVYAGLFTASPSDAGGGTEVTGGSYARVAITFGAPTGTSPTQVANSAAVNFATATASWGTVTDFGIFDAVSAGNLLYWDALTTSKTIGNGDTASFAIGDLVVTED